MELFSIKSFLLSHGQLQHQLEQLQARVPPIVIFVVAVAFVLAVSFFYFKWKDQDHYCVALEAGQLHMGTLAVDQGQDEQLPYQHDQQIAGVDRPTQTFEGTTAMTSTSVDADHSKVDRSVEDPVVAFRSSTSAMLIAATCSRVQVDQQLVVVARTNQQHHTLGQPPAASATSTYRREDLPRCVDEEGQGEAGSATTCSKEHHGRDFHHETQLEELLDPNAGHSRRYSSMSTSAPSPLSTDEEAASPSFNIPIIERQENGREVEVEVDLASFSDAEEEIDLRALHRAIQLDRFRSYSRPGTMV
ncbi:unnamed protein product [Amoebophrya sp. A120]|nr:unnamed protein product [Amoebophrya sp. A120]|eukprot:GSA120T00008058001.1